MRFDFHWGEKTPSSNTGLNSQITPLPINDLTPRFEVKIDTITGVYRDVFSENDAVAIINRYEDFFNDKMAFWPDRTVTRGKTWDGTTSDSLRGLQLCWQRPEAGQPGQLLFHIPGKAIQNVEQDNLRSFLELLGGIYGAEYTRCDIALDDYRKLLDFGRVKDALRSGSLSGARTYRILESCTDGVTGETIYAGSTKSDKMVRLYDKSAESKGEFDCHRWEVQFRRFKANYVMQSWFLTPDVPKFLSSVAIGAVDFVDRSSGDKNLARLPRLLWWEEFVFLVGQGVKVPCKKIVSSLQKSANWFFHGGPAKFIVRLEQAKGFQAALDFVVAGMEEAREKFSQSDRAKSQIYATEQLLY